MNPFLTVSDSVLSLIAAMAGIAAVVVALLLKGRKTGYEDRSQLYETSQSARSITIWIKLALVIGIFAILLAIWSIVYNYMH